MSGGFTGFSPIEVDTRQLRSCKGSGPTENYTFSGNEESKALGDMELKDFTMSLSPADN